jgi:hypothetical protein
MHAAVMNLAGQSSACSGEGASATAFCAFNAAAFNGGGNADCGPAANAQPQVNDINTKARIHEAPRTYGTPSVRAGPLTIWTTDISAKHRPGRLG